VIPRGFFIEGSRKSEIQIISVTNINLMKFSIGGICMGHEDYLFLTERLLIRVYTDEDADIIHPVLNRREIAETTLMIPHPYPKEHVYWWINYVKENMEKEEAYEFGLFDKTDPKTYIGNIGLIGISKQHNNAELAYFINPDLWNRGYATEACRWILDFGFEKLGLERIHGRCMSKNIGSRRVMEKSGLIYEGTARHEVLKWGKYEDVCKYGIIRCEWEKRKRKQNDMSHSRGELNIFVLTTLTEAYAKEICGWKYEGEYSVYNFSDWDEVVENGWDLAIKERREADFVAILSDNQLIAYGRITKDQNKAFIGIGLKPSLCGKGLGKEVMQLLISECQKRFPDSLIVLEVRSFNKRAVKCYESVGFKIRDKYIKKTSAGDGEFYYMEYEPSQISNE